MHCYFRAIASACAIVCAEPAAANLIANGSFEDGTFTGGASLAQQVAPGDSTTLSGWTVSDASLTWYENGFNLQQIAISGHNGNFAVNLADGSVRTVTASQTFPTLPFQEYQVSYWVGNYSANNGPAAIIANVVDGTSNTILLSETATAPATNEPSTWVRFVSTFIADGTSNTISFTEINGPSYIGLDDVSVIAVPEPSTWGLALAGFAGLGYVSYRRERKPSPSGVRMAII